MLFTVISIYIILVSAIAAVHYIGTIVKLSSLKSRFGKAKDLPDEAARFDELHAIAYAMPSVARSKKVSPPAGALASLVLTGACIAGVLACAVTVRGGSLLAFTGKAPALAAVAAALAAAAFVALAVSRSKAASLAGSITAFASELGYEAGDKPVAPGSAEALRTGFLPLGCSKGLYRPWAVIPRATPPAEEPEEDEEDVKPANAPKRRRRNKKRRKGKRKKH